ncbi:MAG: hypothetical protein NVSMB1_22220 [Polyangiales bacterium]
MRPKVWLGAMADPTILCCTASDKWKRFHSTLRFGADAALAGRTQSRHKHDMNQPGFPSTRLALSPPGEVPFTVEMKIGRLVEMRFNASIWTQDDVRAFSEVLVPACGGAGPNFVICVDYRRARLFAPELVDKWAALMKLVHPRMDRAAVLLDPHNALFNLQLQRVVAEAGSTSRRAFFDAAELQAWLSGVLSFAERARLTLFLSNFSASAPRSNRPPAKP